ncbi:hypothetical protein KKI23_00120 [Patescibacteria group bacterium]|nr:hypothetical protein [Patescibacteria group bacterium]
MAKESEKEILSGSGFSSRSQIAETIGYLRRDLARLRPDEGDSEDKEQERERVKAALKRVEELGCRLGISPKEISEGVVVATQRVQRTAHRSQMVSRTAQALVRLGPGSLSDSEISAMERDSGFADSVEAEADRIRRNKD